MKSKIALIIGSSLLIINCGCMTWDNSNHVKWTIPNQPKISPVTFISVKADANNKLKEDIVYMNLEGSKNLMSNIDEMDAYIKNLLALIAQMQKYYEGK